MELKPRSKKFAGTEWSASLSAPVFFYYGQFLGNLNKSPQGRRKPFFFMPDHLRYHVAPYMTLSIIFFDDSSQQQSLAIIISLR
jgi:hypothetical protein